MANDILQWNPSSNNQQTNGEYLVDPMRTGGAVPGIFTKELANKLFYQLTTVCSALGEMMSNKGYTVSDANIASLITVFSNILTKADFGVTANTVCQGNDDRLNKAGMKVWFWQNVAPTGWTIDASAADAVLAVKGGTGTYNANGGTQQGTWTHPDHYHTTQGHTLTINEMPSHTHDAATGATVSDGSAIMHTAGTQYIETIAIATGGGQSHSHGDTGLSATANTWRPLAQVGIICTKN